MNPTMIAFNSADLVTLAPEIFLLGATCAILLIDLFLKPGQRHITHVLALLALAGTAGLLWQDADAPRVYAFNGMFIRDGVAGLLKLFIVLTTALVFLYSRSYMRERKLLVGEFYLLLLFATLGMMLLVSAGSLVTVYVGLELLTLSSYALVALNRESTLSSEAAIKYFVLGALASGMLLYGMSMLYGATGTLDLARINALADLSAAAPHRTLLAFGLVFLVVGIGFKLGAAPFHMWLPDVYHGAPTSITLFISSGSKLAAVGMAYRLLEGALGTMHTDWTTMLSVLAVLSLAVGNVIAIAQTNLKRMLAYSTISHIGFLLLGFINGTAAGIAAAVFYMICYALMATAAFGVMMLLARAGFEAEEIDDFKGLNQRSRWYAFLMLLVMFSLTGIPVLLGFWAKLAVLQVAFEAGYHGVVVAAVMFSLIGAFYYLRVVRTMYFDAPVDTAPIDNYADQRVLIAVNGLALLVLGMAPGWLLALCRQAVEASL